MTDVDDWPQPVGTVACVSKAKGFRIVAAHRDSGSVKERIWKGRLFSPSTASKSVAYAERGVFLLVSDCLSCAGVVTSELFINRTRGIQMGVLSSLALICRSSLWRVLLLKLLTNASRH